MRKAAVRHGDPTTTRGFVLAYSSTIHDDGKQVALSGDEATCGNCKGLFKIFGTGAGMSEKGRVVVIDGDQVLCPCKKNRVIVGSNPGIFLKTTDGSARASSVAATTSPSQPVDEAKYSRWCLVRDGVTGEPVANRSFVADVGGRSQHGKTDGQGYAKIETNGEQSFNIHVIFSSPKRVLKPRQGN
ncbi:PAAR domain-containing protein [Caballeronia sordidicola]|uniref:PAAR domain-containing protein n=1 Tax=Caballeronia sordidicola TaxID=196367 RepID=UPI00068B6217|nr:PAAR domain-containing protein [Caballeronia sordidicola]